MKEHMQEHIRTAIGIAAVERETRLSKDVLRVWERRYGFPAPARDVHGERVYTPEQVERLCLIRRLMDMGRRPGALVGLDTDALARLLAQAAPAAIASTGVAVDPDLLDALLMPIKAHDPGRFHDALRRQLAVQGLQAFVEFTLAPLTVEVGLRWEDGRFAVFEEHLYTEVVQRVLRQAIGGLPSVRGDPVILLTSLPGEEHVLGLLMAEALFSIEGAACVAIGAGTPALEIARAVSAYRADVVALSCSAAYPARRLAAEVAQLRELLPEPVALWAGGAGYARLDGIAGVLGLPTLADGRRALQCWRMR